MSTPKPSDVILQDGYEYVRNDIVPQLLYDHANQEAIHTIATRTPLTHHEVEALVRALGYPRIRVIAQQLNPPTLRTRLRNWQPFAFLKP